MSIFFNEPIYLLAEKIKKSEVKSVELIKATLEKINLKDKEISSFISVFKEQAISAAEKIDSLSFEEKKEKKLCGIPIAIKDNICYKEGPTTCASKMLENFIPPYNATVVDALVSEGAIIIGKTNLDEFAMGSTTETSYFGVTKNPNHPEYVSGGSSGGSAACVAAGFVPASLGSDTGGSIRQPSSFCGVYGLKPTYGRVSRYGLVAFASSLDQIGPIANNVKDLGLLLSIISVPDKKDSTNARKQFENNENIYNCNLSSLTIGIPKEYFSDGISDDVKNSVEAVISFLKQMGCKIKEISLPYLNYAIATYYIICTAEASSNLARYDGVKYGYRSSNTKSLIDMYKSTRSEGFGAEVKRRIMLGTYVLSSGYYDAYYLKAARVRTLITQDFENAFTNCDAIISPVSSSTAFKIGEKSNDPLGMYLTDLYTVSANLAGIPAISVPCGKNHQNLPIGVQFMAPKWREDILLKIGFAIQEKYYRK
jgi:aspartyl-tRNA(Asn)/glutamyl-tRNA(Gln) amidotransferase subunit A